MKETPTGVDGITNIEYQILAKHPQTSEFIGYKSKIETKTVYDPKKITDKKILELGQQSAVKAYREAILSKNGQASATIDNIKFRVYINKNTGEVKNFHPE